MTRKQQKKLADFSKWLSECPVHNKYRSSNPMTSCTECGETPENMIEYYFKFIVPANMPTINKERK